MTVTLSENAARIVAEQVQQGRYETIVQAVESAVARLKFQEDFDRDNLEELRAAIDVGLAEADRGEFVEFTAESIMAEVREHLRKEQDIGQCR